MIRTNVHFADEQLRRLRAISDRTGISVAEHVRRAIDAYLRRDESRTKETAKR